jgi:hypothetical protein
MEQMTPQCIDDVVVVGRNCFKEIHFKVGMEKK